MKILLLGHTGKLGRSLMEVYQGQAIIGKNSKDFDASDYRQVRQLIIDEKPEAVINAIAYLGIDPCEKNRELAFRLNTLFPYNLARYATQYRFLLVHFSTDAVFDGERTNYPYTEMDGMRPVNYYGMTKAQGDWAVEQHARQYYIFRLSVLFGKSDKNQFVEKLLKWMKERPSIKVADDIIMSPSYSKDVAREVKRLIGIHMPWGTYHIVNKGRASLFDLAKEIGEQIGYLDIDRASYQDFPFIGRKNLCTPLSSWKIDQLRPWQEAIKDYCQELKGNLH